MPNERQRLRTGRSSPIQPHAVPEPADGTAALGPPVGETRGTGRIMFRDFRDLPNGKLSEAIAEKFAHSAGLRCQASGAGQGQTRGPPTRAKVQRPFLRQLCRRVRHPHKVRVPESARGAERTARPVALPETPHFPPHTSRHSGPAELIAMPRQCIFRPKPEMTGATGPVLRSGGKRQRTCACFSRDPGRRDCSRPSPCAS